MVKITGTIIKQEPAHKTGYYIVIQEEKSGKEHRAFSQWSYNQRANGLFTLRQDNKYYFYYWLSRNKRAEPKEQNREKVSESRGGTVLPKH